MIPTQFTFNLDNIGYYVTSYLQGQYRKALSSLHQMASMQYPQPGQQSPSGQASLEHCRALIQQASCHYALGEYRVHAFAQNTS